MDILIKNGIIITQDDERKIFKGNIAINGNLITYVGKEMPSGNFDSIIDATDKLVLPGFINTHTHVAMTGFKGLLDDMELNEFLNKTSELDSKRTDDGIFNSSLLGIYEMINGGITSFLDLYYSEDIIESAVKKTGIRAYLAWATLDREFTTQKGEPVNNAENFIKQTHADTVKPLIGVQGIYVSSDENYYRVKDISKKYGVKIHTHLSETRQEVYDFVKKNGERPVEHLYKINFLDDNVIAAHTVWVTLNEIKMLAKSGTKVSWNAVSNAKLASGGTMPVPEMIANNVNISLGTDSSGSNNSLNMFEEMKFSSLMINNDRWNADTVKSQQILDMATRNAGKALGENIGILKPGYLADLIIIDGRAVNMIASNENNAINNIIFSATPENVRFVIVNGRILKHDGNIPGFDPEKFARLNYL